MGCTTLCDPLQNEKIMINENTFLPGRPPVVFMGQQGIFHFLFIHVVLYKIYHLVLPILHIDVNMFFSWYR